MDVSECSKGMKNSRKDELQETNKHKTESDDEQKCDVEWSNSDKRILLKALRTYGSKNISAISKMLPNISPQAIQLKIAEYSYIACDMYEQKLVNKWLKCGLYEPGDSLVPEALLCIQMFEDHPSPSESDGYDFKAIYNYLYRSCFGKVSAFELSEKDRILLCSILKGVEDKVWPKCKEDIWEYIGRVYNKRHIKKVYPGKSVHSL